LSRVCSVQLGGFVLGDGLFELVAAHFHFDRASSAFNAFTTTRHVATALGASAGKVSIVTILSSAWAGDSPVLETNSSLSGSVQTSWMFVPGVEPS